MIVYLKHTEIDKKKWDECIKQSFNGNTYVCSWYLDLVHEGWEALVEEDYQRVMPLTLRKKFGITYYYQPFFTQQFGVFSINILNPKIIEDFISKIPVHVKLIDVNFNIFNKFAEEKYHLISNNNYLLDLINEYPKLASKYSNNTKRNLKKSLENNLIFMKGVKPESVISLFRTNRGADITKWTEKNYVVLQRIMYKAIHKGMGTTCGVYSENNELCAAAFFLKNNNRLIFLFSGSDEVARTNGAMTFLIDTVIRDNSPGGRILDFEGSNNENLARYYKGFGAKKTTYTRLKINRLNFVMKIIFNIYNLFCKSKK
ncbi:MAG: hypothetical protein H8E34_01290 [Bacteroidetes bacterium]|nr:hypothetical protein [Bacteroidota bacterium]MBL6943069.1 hypothetical protein [Bacteroidales bacterium]